ncbi:NAD-dependent succinate-semialdehyde dehydrogenase [Oceanobacillus luteolus]|uniref:NAD-dependent succinate-semialdehyde dehydrogenase n=1 Tax=Oceanobacillus luteolus TaxID=1274358 RepID=A0ABW4HMZ8_9BACI
MYINGKWIQTEHTLVVKSPATNEIVSEVPLGDASHVQQAIDAAKASFPAWSKLVAQERSNILLAIADKMTDKKELLASMITREMGKPIGDSMGEVQQSIDYFRWYSEEAKRVYGETIPSSSADKRIMVMKQPIGVVGAITPWNFPISMLARKLGPALAVGCTVVVKPASQTPQCAVELFKIFDEVGVPAGVLNLVIAKASTVSETFMNSPEVRKITFTGSTSVGKRLIEGSAKTVKRVSMELGGHAPFIVFDDADLDDAIDGLLRTKFRCSGQMCTSTNRIYVQSSILETFSQKLAERVSKLKTGNGFNQDTNVGPLVDEQALAKVLAQVKDAKEKGAKVLVGGERLTGGEYDNGNFFMPTVLGEVSEDMLIYSDETFGPVAPIISFETEEAILEKVNHEQYGLASYVYTNDMSRIIRITEGIEYGMIGVNDPLPFTVQAPFGGVKESGMGREGGHHGLNDYLEEKMVSIRFKV